LALALVIIAPMQAIASIQRTRRRGGVGFMLRTSLQGWGGYGITGTRVLAGIDIGDDSVSGLFVHACYHLTTLTP